MSGLQLKSNPSEDAVGEATVAVPASGGPPPLPPKSAPSISVPPPPPAAPIAPTPTSLNVAPQSVNSGTGAARVIVWMLIILAVNGIGFGIYYFARGGLDGWLGGAMEELVEDAYPLEEETFRAVLDPAVEQAMYEQAYQIDWPVVVLSGMVATSSDEKTSAILNGNLVSLLQGIDGATLIEVRPDGVVLQYERTRKFIRVGEST